MAHEALVVYSVSLLLLPLSGCSCDNDALQGELADLRELMAGEAASRVALQDSLDESERQLGELRNELDMTKSVSFQLFAKAGHKLACTLCVALLKSYVQWVGCGAGQHAQRAHRGGAQLSHNPSATTSSAPFTKMFFQLLLQCRCRR